MIRATLKTGYTAAICFPLFVFVTSVAIAPNAFPQTKTAVETTSLNMPPEDVNFDLSDLIDAGREQRERWNAFQEEMTVAYKETEIFVESETNPTIALEAWSRFLEAFDTDNPFTNEDESMRDTARDSMSNLREVRRSLQVAEWETYQSTMRRAYGEVEAFLEEVADPKLKTLALERFLESFSEDNPFSDDDETLRDTATSNLEKLD